METGRHPSAVSTRCSVDFSAFSPSQEIDFKDTQLRLVREQTANCIKDLNALRTEVMLLKSDQKSDRLNSSALANSLEGKQLEVQEHFEREKRERAAVLQQISRKVNDLERELPSIRDEMSLMREQLRSMETWQPHVEDLQCSFLKDVEARHQAHGQLEQKIAEIDAGMTRHSVLHKDLQDRLIGVHQEHVEKLGRELHTHVAKVSEMQERVDFIESLLGDNEQKHSEELKKTQDRLSEHATAERVDYLEKALGDSSDRHTRELEALKVAHQKMVAEHKGQEQGHGQVSDRVTQLQREKEELRAHHMSLTERMDYLETLLGESAEKHAQELETFKDKHAKLDAGANKLRSHHAGLEERMEYLEAKIGDSFDKHAKELSNVHAKVEELHGKLQDQKSTREEKLLYFNGHLQQQVTAQKTGDERHASMEEMEAVERLKFLESLMGDNAELGKESRQVVKVLEEKHAGVLDRLDSVEKEQAARQKIEEVMKCKTQEQEKHNETQAELVDSLQRTVGIFDTLIRKDMEERKSEMKRLWEVVDGLTQDRASSKVKVASDGEDVEEKSLRPSRFSRSSPSLVNATSTARPGATSSSTRLVTYRPISLSHNTGKSSVISNDRTGTGNCTSGYRATKQAVRA